MSYLLDLKNAVDFDTVEIISFDLWDTLLRRDCHPEETKLRTCQQITNIYGPVLHPEYVDALSLLSLRNQAEFDLAMQSRERGLDDEYEITNVLRRVIETAVSPNELGADFEQSLARLVDHEIETELSATRLDATALQVLSQTQHIPRVVISDFYMTHQHLSLLLSAHGILECFERVISSCDVGLNKKSGRLFDYAKKEFDANPERWLHIGDNAHSDVAMAAKEGLIGFHHNIVREEAQRKVVARRFEARKQSGSAIVSDFKETGARPNGLVQPGVGRLADSLSLITGLIGERLFAHAEAVACDQVVFFGANIAPIAEMLMRIAPATITLQSLPIPPSSISAGREELIALAQTAIDEMGACTPAEVLKRAGLKPAHFQSLIARWRLASNEPVSSPSAPALQNVLFSQQVQTALQEQIDRNVEGCKRLIAELNVDRKNRVLIVYDPADKKSLQGVQKLFSSWDVNVLPLQGSAEGSLVGEGALIPIACVKAHAKGLAVYRDCLSSARGEAVGLYEIMGTMQIAFSPESKIDQKRLSFIQRLQSLVREEIHPAYDSIRRRGMNDSELSDVLASALSGIEIYGHLIEETMNAKATFHATSA